jgi:hypothetical protein
VLLTAIYSLRFIGFLAAGPPDPVKPGRNGRGEIDSLIRSAPADLPGADAVVLLDRVQVTIDGRSNPTVDRLCLVKILTEPGRQDNSQIAVRFDPATERSEVLLAKVHSPDGTTLPATPQPGAIRFPDFPLGSVLEYRVKLSPRKPARRAAFSGAEPVGGYQPVLNQELAVTFPKGREFHWARSVPRDPEPEPLIPEQQTRSPKIDTMGKLIRYTWTSRLPQALPREPGEPALERRVPRILFSSYPTWREVAQTLRAEWSSALAPTTELKQKAHQLGLGKSKPEALRAIFRYVSEEIPTEPGDFNIARHKPIAAGQVMKQGTGSLLDKSGLLTALLNAEGFNAFLLPIRTNGLPVIKEVPAPEAFDRVVVLAFLDNNPGYFDPSAGRQPYGRLPEFDQGAEGLVLDPQNYRFVTIPVEEYDRNLAQITGDVFLKRDGSATGTLAAKLTGYYDVRIRELLSSARPVQSTLAELASRLVTDAPATDAGSKDVSPIVRIDSVSTSDVSDILKPVELFVGYTILRLTPDPGSRSSVLLPVPVLALDSLFGLTRTETRRTNLVVPPWRICRFTCLVHLENGMTANSLDPTWFKETPAIRATRRWEEKPAGIEFRSEFMLKKTDLNPDDYRQVKAVADEFRKPGMRQLRVNR